MTVGKTYQFKSDGIRFIFLGLNKKGPKQIDIEYLNASTKNGRRTIMPSKNTEIIEV